MRATSTLSRVRAIRSRTHSRGGDVAADRRQVAGRRVDQDLSRPQGEAGAVDRGRAPLLQPEVEGGERDPEGRTACLPDCWAVTAVFRTTEWSLLIGNSGLVTLVGSENGGAIRSTRCSSGAIGSSPSPAALRWAAAGCGTLVVAVSSHGPGQRVAAELLATASPRLTPAATRATARPALIRTAVPQRVEG